MLLAVSTSASKFPSVTAWIFSWILSAMFFVLNGLPQAAVFLSFVSLIRCCNRHLVSSDIGPAPRSGCTASYSFRILRRRRLPRKILGHSVQLDAFPDALVGAMLHRLPNARIMRAPEYSTNLKPVPVPCSRSNDSIVSSSPPVALTIGTVPYFKL